MKKVLLIVAIPLLLGGGIFAYYNAKIAPKAVAAVTTAVVERSSIRSSIASTGKVVSNLDVDIKCKASGEVVKVGFDVSDTVRKGDLLLELDPVDEARMVKQSQAALSASQAKLDSARQTLEIATRTLDTDSQRAALAASAAEARSRDARSKADRLRDLTDKKLSSQEELETAETAAVQAESDASAAKVHLKEIETQRQGLELSRQQIRLAEAAVDSDHISLDLEQQRLVDTKVVAPMDGVVTQQNVQIGQIISSGISNVGGGTTAMTLSDLSRIFVLASVDESDIGKVALGQDVVITVDAYPLKKFSGKVVRISTRGVNVSNVVTFEVKIEVQPDAGAGRGGVASSASTAASQRAAAPTSRMASSDPAKRGGASARGDRRGGGDVSKNLLKPEMTANVELVVAQKDDVLTAPSDSFLRKEGKLIAVVVKDGVQQERPVQIGISDGQKTEIISGLSEGETVVVNKNAADSRWKDAQRSASPRGMMGGGSPRGH